MMSNSAEVAPLLATRESHSSSMSTLPRWQSVTLLLLIGWLYTPILVRLVLQWVGPHSDPNFQHGIFVPLFALYILWLDRRRLKAKAIDREPSWAGLPLIALSLCILALGRLGAELFFSRVSFLILLAGLIILFLGWPFFRAVLFPWAFLILMIPLPNLILQQVTFPLQLLASRLATELLQVFGVPVLRQGNLIVLAAMPLDVAEACSGIRSLLTLVTLAIIYGYLMETRKWVRVVLAISAVPIAVAANSVRVFGTGLIVQYWDADKAEGFLHTFQGLLVYVVALIMLFAVHRAICLIWQGTPGVPDRLASNTPNNSPRDIKPRYPRSFSVSSSNISIIKDGSLRFAIVAVLLLGTAVTLQVHSHSEVFPPRAPLSSLPQHIDGWTGTDEALDQQTLDILGPGEFLLRQYQYSIPSTTPSQSRSEPQSESQSESWINLWIAYFPTQRTGDTIHSPNHCLPGAGWIPTVRERVEIARPDGSRFPANRYVISKSGERQLVLYWFQAHGREVASEYWAKYYLVADSIRMNRSDGALVRLMTPMLNRESRDAAQTRMMRLGSQFLPLLDNYIPR